MTADRPATTDELLDPDGEGIYLNSEQYGVLMRAAWILLGDAREWRDVSVALVYMRPKKDGDEWMPANIGRWPRGWRLNLPERLTGIRLFYYCTPKVEA